jgi:hypothetical protein
VTAGDGPTAAEVETAGRAFRVAFHPPAGPVLAGGPAVLDAVVSLAAGDPVKVLTSSARATGRSGEYLFEATGPDGGPLRDPYADAIEIGGVETQRLVTTDESLAERVLLNQFLALESVRETVPEGAGAELVVRCARLLRLEGVPEEPPTAALAVHLRVHRDDAALARYYAEAADTIMGSAQVGVASEQRLVELCNARNELAAGALSSLTAHPDAGVAARARYALAALG